MNRTIAVAAIGASTVLHYINVRETYNAPIMHTIQLEL